MATGAKLDRSSKRVHRVGGFGIEILFPGMTLNEGDSGIGAIGRIDHARVTPGTVIAMHPHRDDEILTYLRQGTVQHRDTIGHTEEISNTRLMLMNAGYTFQHEEMVLPVGGTLEGLQIFLRPRTADLEPLVQFHELDASVSANAWRLLAGPSDAPLTVRADAWVHDARLHAGREMDLPPTPRRAVRRLLYVFTGHVSAAGVTLTEGESILLDDGDYRAVAEQHSDLVLFTTDPNAEVFRGGMFSGNVMAHYRSGGRAMR
jgi:redox-sensitive bicupin YhaK (pirin superfamily)